MSLASSVSRFFPSGVRERGYSLSRMGAVKNLSGDPGRLEAQVSGSQIYHVHCERDGPKLLAGCECPYFDTEGACKHIWAALLSADGTGYLMGVRGQPPSILVENWPDEYEDEGLFADPEAQKRKKIVAISRPYGADIPKIPEWQSLVSQVKTYGETETREPWPSRREIYYVIDAQATVTGNHGLMLEVGHRDPKKTGGWGKLKTARFPRNTIPLIPDERDREILAILGGVPDTSNYYNYSSISYSYLLKDSLQRILLPKICATGRCLFRKERYLEFGQLMPLQWDEGPSWEFRLVVKKAGQNLVVSGRLDRQAQNGTDVEQMDIGEPVMLTDDGLLFARGLVSRFDDGHAFGWITLLRRQRQFEVPVTDGAEFLRTVIERALPARVEWPEDLKFEDVTIDPQPCLRIEEPQYRHRSQNPMLVGNLTFDYEGKTVHGHDRTPGIYDDEHRRLVRRNPAAEQSAARQLSDLRIKPAPRAYGEPGDSYQIPPKQLPHIVRDLLKAGWHVEAEGKAFRRPSSFHAELTSGVDWFELHGAVDYGNGEVRLPDLLNALKKGENLVPLGDGSYGLLPEELLQQYGLLLSVGKPHGDHMRFSRAQTGLLDAILATREEVSVDSVFARAREQIRKFERIEPAPQPAGFVGELRGYQREGVAWMQFLQGLGFGGCVADDMGVGKTPQMLALLETRRELREAGQTIGPSLVVVPRSLIYNWRQEAERFTPRLRVLDHSGAGRSKSLERFANYDLILTTYGTLRRDVVDYQDIRFDYIVLDEAQAIKNIDSESAKAARLLRGDHRLVMSGTPIENHLGELWSLFEFLNPGMLGSMSALSLTGRALRNPDEPTRQLLAQALRPFILRRTKDQVAPELPQKLEQTIYCELDREQRKLYNDLRDHYRRSLLGVIEQSGIAKSKMQILEALLRLRQAACHPGLIDKKRTGEPSAKLESLIPQLAEVLDAGHKVLVFSQFTSLLAIVRNRLDAASIAYEYLDGKTKDRQARVERFQGDPNCKLFLISLKAGGVGLNLTAAEYVFLLDPWWNPAVEAQAVDRAHRIGQTRPVFAYRLIARDTVEEKVLELQNSKRNLADAIIRADTGLVRDLKREDLDFLFS